MIIKIKCWPVFKQDPARVAKVCITSGGAGGYDAAPATV